MQSSGAVASSTTAGTQADERDAVVGTFWLGWDIAELRGRCRPEFVHVSPPPARARVDHALPMSNERSEREQEIQLVEELSNLVDQLGLANIERNGVPPLRAISEARHQVSGSHDTAAQHSAWEKVSELFYEWDAELQDRFLMQPGRAAAYQLGRGMAETYWALDPSIDDPEDWRSWGFLLGLRRCQRMKQLVARLSAFTDPMTPVVVWASLDAWRDFAADPSRPRQEDARMRLYEQGVLWRDLIRGEQRPADLIHTRGEVTRIAVLPAVIKAFRFEIALASVAAAVLVVAGTAIAQGSHSLGSTVGVFLSGIGLTAAGLFARAKAVASSLFEQLKQEVTRAQTARAATYAPSRRKQAGG